MTTEELARRFCELAGWDVSEWDKFRTAYRVGDRARFVASHFTGWEGVGVCVDEMARRGWTYMLRTWSERHHVAGFTKENWPTEDDFLGTYEKRNGAVGDTPLDAVLAAAIAALEAEAKP